MTEKDGFIASIADRDSIIKLQAAEIEALKAELGEWRFTNRIDELYRSLERKDALLREALDRLLPYRSTVMRWITPIDKAIENIKKELGETP